MKQGLWMAAWLLLGTGPGAAQEAPVLAEGEVTQKALVDALAPAREVRTRSLRVRRDDEVGGQAAKPASASLLITFETNSAALTAAARRSLDVVGAALSSEKLAGSRFAIEGHADPRGMPQANLKLSQSRAESVREYLVGNGKIDTARIDAVGKGDRELMNRDNPAAAENRRVTIVNLSR
ncbi:OmpA family protein [Pseudoduganella chitinolytica]|uniref:OmpA family protein n=1 Tax=Pseudoduganella chitinolytica TaxID=34070 RepID=A0ABY8BFP6_9BURK|nr:OmpA family protein [Pseudoduganella chitinolytica]WEF34208.1 OmpA family protein [Pseudoduganella chitinolytica]